MPGRMAVLSVSFPSDPVPGIRPAVLGTAAAAMGTAAATIAVLVSCHICDAHPSGRDGQDTDRIVDNRAGSVTGRV